MAVVKLVLVSGSKVVVVKETVFVTGTKGVMSEAVLVLGKAAIFVSGSGVFVTSSTSFRKWSFCNSSSASFRMWSFCNCFRKLSRRT